MSQFQPFACYSSTAVLTRTYGHPSGMPSEVGKSMLNVLYRIQYVTVKEWYPVFTGDISTEEVDLKEIRTESNGAAYLLKILQDTSQSKNRT